MAERSTYFLLLNIKKLPKDKTIKQFAKSLEPLFAYGTNDAGDKPVVAHEKKDGKDYIRVDFHIYATKYTIAKKLHQYKLFKVVTEIIHASSFKFMLDEDQRKALDAYATSGSEDESNSLMARVEASNKKRKIKRKTN